MIINASATVKHFKNKTIFFAELIHKVRIKTVLDEKIKMTAVNPMMTLLPCLTLVQPMEEDTKESKDELAVYQLKVKAMDRASTTVEKYKINVQRFSDGTPQELIILLIKLDEIWMQNSVNGVMDLLVTVRTILRGEALSIFEEALEGARLNRNTSSNDPRSC